MGHFYTNVTLKGPDHKIIVATVRRMGREAAVSPTYGDCTVMCDDDLERSGGDGFGLIESLTRALSCVALCVTNHDDSVLAYDLYIAGSVVDSYSSCPGYFGSPNPPPRGGDAKALCDAFGAMSAVDRLGEILNYDKTLEENDDSDRYVWEVDRHREIADALGIPTLAAGFGYRYQSKGEFPDGLLPQRVASISGEEVVYRVR